MVETESKSGAAFYVMTYVNKCMTWAKGNKMLFVMLVSVVLIALIPLYGVLFPPNVDLPEHILISKLLWEKLTGISNLDIEISSFIGYRLSPVFLASVLAFCKLVGIPLVYLPKIVVTLLIALHALVVVTALHLGLKDKTWKSYLFAVSFSLPAVVSMYAACWFIGFIGYTMAITLLIPAIFLTERFLRSGKMTDAALLFLALLLVYTAHPFAEAFWLMWCGCRVMAAVVTRTFVLEWKKMILLGVVFLPILLYNLWGTAGTELAMSGLTFNQFPFVSPGEWYQNRLGDLLGGNMLKADHVAGSRVFAVVAIGLILLTTVLAFRFTQNQRAKSLMLASTLLLFISSWVNEKFIPSPGALWIAWDYRYTSTVFAVCLAVAGMVLIRFLPVSTDKLQYKVMFVILAFFSVFGSIYHLVEVREAYARFDAPARQYMAKIFSNEDPAGIWLPRSRWHPDGTLIRLYICLEQPDCNPEGSMFKSLGGTIWAVKIKSATRRVPEGAPPVIPAVQPTNAFLGGDGYAGGQFSKPRGIAADNMGNLYVADTGNARLQKFDVDGNFIAAFGRVGGGEGEFREPNGIVVDASGNIYVTDPANGKLMKFGPDGKFTKEWKGPDPGFYGPRDIAIGPNNQLYIIDQGRTRTVRFDPATEVFSEWGSWGAGEGQFLQSTGIAVGGDFVFVTDLGNNRIQVFDLDGKFVRQWEVPVWEKYPWHYPDAAFDEQTKRLYVTNGWKNEVLVFDLDGNYLESLKSTPPAELSNPSSLVLSKTKNGKSLYVLNTGSHRVSVFELSKTKLK